MNCIFCKIIEGAFSSMKVYEDEHAMVIMDVADDVNGHMLAMPKKHVKSILDCDTETLHHLMDAVKKVSNHLVDNCGYEGVNLLNANDESAGQSIPHLHIHMIPRKREDGIDAWPKFPGRDKEISQLFESIKMM